MRALIERLKLSQVDAAHRLGINPRTLRRWVAGRARIPEAVGQLLAEWAKQADARERKGGRRRDSGL